MLSMFHCIMQVHLKGGLLLQCRMVGGAFAHVVLSPQQSQRRWLLTARSAAGEGQKVWLCVS